MAPIRDLSPKSKLQKNDFRPSNSQPDAQDLITELSSSSSRQLYYQTYGSYVLTSPVMGFLHVHTPNTLASTVVTATVGAGGAAVTLKATQTFADGSPLSNKNCVWDNPYLNCTLSEAQLNNWAGAYWVDFRDSSDNQVAQIAINIIPHFVNRDSSTPANDDSCDNPMFPFHYGYDEEVVIKAMHQHNWPSSVYDGFIALAGYAKNAQPFSESTTIKNGFISLISPSAKHLWTYRLSTIKPSDAYDSECNQVESSDTDVFAICSIRNYMYSNEVTKKPLLIRVLIGNGMLYRAKYLPHPGASPLDLKGVYLRQVIANSERFITSAYQYMNSDVKTVAIANAALTSNEITFRVVNILPASSGQSNFPDLQLAQIGNGVGMFAVYQSIDLQPKIMKLTYYDGNYAVTAVKSVDSSLRAFRYIHSLQEDTHNYLVFASQPSTVMEAFIYKMAVADLSVAANNKVTYSNTLSFYSFQVQTVYSDPTKIYLIATSGKHASLLPGPVMITVFDSSLSLITNVYWKPNNQFTNSLIQYTGRPTKLMFAINSRFSSDSANTYDSSFIFNNPLERNCFTLTTDTSLVTVTVSDSTSAAYITSETVQSMSTYMTISTDATFLASNSPVYLRYDTQSFTDDKAKRFSWGNKPIPGITHDNIPTGGNTRVRGLLCGGGYEYYESTKDSTPIVSLDKGVSGTQSFYLDNINSFASSVTGDSTSIKMNTLSCSGRQYSRVNSQAFEGGSTNAFSPLNTFEDGTNDESSSYLFNKQASDDARCFYVNGKATDYYRTSMAIDDHFLVRQEYSNYNHPETNIRDCWNQIFPIVFDSKCSDSDCGFKMAGIISIKNDNDLLVYGSAGASQQQFKTSKAAREGFVMRINDLGTVEFLTQIQIRPDRNEEVKSCNTEQSTIFCYVEGRPTTGSLDPSGFRHAIITLEKATGNLIRSVYMHQLMSGSTQLYMQEMRNIVPFAGSEPLVYISGLFSKMVTGSPQYISGNIFLNWNNFNVISSLSHTIGGWRTSNTMQQIGVPLLHNANVNTLLEAAIQTDSSQTTGVLVVTKYSNTGSIVWSKTVASIGTQTAGSQQVQIMTEDPDSGSNYMVFFRLGSSIKAIKITDDAAGTIANAQEYTYTFGSGTPLAFEFFYRSQSTGPKYNLVYKLVGQTKFQVAEFALTNAFSAPSKIVTTALEYSGVGDSYQRLAVVNTNDNIKGIFLGMNINVGQNNYQTQGQSFAIYRLNIDVPITVDDDFVKYKNDDYLYYTSGIDKSATPTLAMTIDTPVYTLDNTDQTAGTGVLQSSTNFIWIKEEVKTRTFQLDHVSARDVVIPFSLKADSPFNNNDYFNIPKSVGKHALVRPPSKQYSTIEHEYNSDYETYEVMIDSSDSNDNPNTCQGYTSVNTASFDGDCGVYSDEYSCFEKQSQGSKQRISIVTNQDDSTLQCSNFRDSYRQILVESCTPNDNIYGDFTNQKICSTSYIPLVFRSNNPASSIWDIQEDCTTQSDLAFPKVIGDLTNDFEILGADSYISTCEEPQFFICGKMTSTYLPLNNFKLESLAHTGFIMSYRTNGRIDWLQTGRHIYSADSSMQSCYAEDVDSAQYVYALMYRSLDSKFSIISFDRSNGDIKLTLQLNGVYNDQYREYAKIVTVGETIYFAGSQNDNSYNRHFNLIKIRHDTSKDSYRYQWISEFKFTDADQDNTLQNHVQSILQTGDDLFYFGQYYEKHSGKYLYLANKISVDHFYPTLTPTTQQIDIGATALNKEYPVALYGTDIYVSAIYQTGSGSTNTYTHKLFRLAQADLALSNDAQGLSGLQYSLTSTVSAPFVSTMAIDGDVIATVFQQTASNVQYIAIFKITPLFVRERLTTLNKEGLQINRLFAFMVTDLDPNTFFTTYSAKSYLSNDKYSGVVNQFQLTGLSDNICTQTIAQTSSSYDTTPFIATIRSTPIDLEYKRNYYERFIDQSTGLYFELKVQYEDFNFVQASGPRFQCTAQNDFSFFADLTPVRYTYYKNGPNPAFEVGLLAPKMCHTPDVEVEVSVDNYQAIPNGFTVVDVEGGKKLIVQPTSESQIGLYTFRVAFNVAGTCNVKHQLMSVAILPEEGRNPLEIGEVCQADSTFQRHQFPTGTYGAQSITFHSNGLAYCMTGQTQTSGGGTVAFLNVYTDYDFLAWQELYTSSYSSDYGVQCLFDSNNDVWLLSQGTSENNDYVITVHQYTFEGIFVKARKMNIPDYYLYAQTIEVVSDKVYVLGGTDYAHILASDSDIEKMFILQLNKADLSYGYFSLIGGDYERPGASDNNVIRSAIVGSDNNAYFISTFYGITIESESSSIPLVTSFNLNTRSLNWVHGIDSQMSGLTQAEAESDYIYYGLAQYSTRLYTCIPYALITFDPLRRMLDTAQHELALQLRDTSSGYTVTKQFELSYESSILSCNILEDTTTNNVILQYSTYDFITQIIVLTRDFAVSQTKYLKFDTSSFNAITWPHAYIFKGKSSEANLFHLALISDMKKGSEDETYPNAFIIEFNVFTGSTSANWKNTCDSGAQFFQQRNIIEINESNLLTNPVHVNYINGGNGIGSKHIDYWVQYNNNIFNVYNIRDDRVKKFVTAPDNLMEYRFESNTTMDSRVPLNDNCQSIFVPRKIANKAGKYNYKTSTADQMIVRTDPYNIPADTFKQCQGLDLTYYVKYFSSSGSDASCLESVHFMSLDDEVSDVITINANTNELANEDGALDDYEIYEIMEFAEVSQFTDRYTTSDAYQIRLNMNKPPLLDEPSVTTIGMTARQRKTFTIRKGYNDEPTDILTFAIVAKKGGVIQSSDDWMAYEISAEDDDLVTVIIDRPPNPVTSDVYSIEITYSDNFNPIPTMKTVALTVSTNNPPYLNERTNSDRNLALNLPKVRIGDSFEHFIPLKGFNDTDIDDYLFLYCDKSALPSWVQLVDNNLGYQIKGTVPASASTGSYNLQCTISDTISYQSYNFVFTVVQASTVNIEPVVQYSKLSDVYIDADDEYYGGLDFCQDGNNHDLTYFFYKIAAQNYYDGLLSTVTTGSLKRKAQNGKEPLYFQNAASTDAGTYWVKFLCTDNQFSAPGGTNLGWGYVKLVAKPNTAPVAQRSSYSANSVSVHYSANTFTFALSNAFTDADKPHTMNSMKFYIADAPNKSQNIAFLSSAYGTTSDNNNVQFTLSNTKSKANAGRYNYYLVAEDPRGAKASMVISILIQGCDSSCKECRGTTKDDCTDCFSGYSKITSGANTYGWCNVTCVNSYRLANNTCVACPSQCSSCTGPNPLTDCNTCNSDKYKFGIQCLDSCSGSLYTTSPSGPYTCQVVAAPLYSENTLRTQTFTYASTLSTTFTLANPQNGVDVKFSYIINKGISTQVNKNANVSSTLPWITTSYNSGTNQLTLSITNAPDAVVPGTNDYYTVYVYMTNRNNQIAEAILQLTHFSNNAPYLRSSVKTALSTFVLPEPVSDKIVKFWFDDHEGDAFTLSCVKPALATWMTLSPNAIGDILISGTPVSSNSYATTYNIDCTVNDGRNYRNSRTYTFTMKINPNQPPVVAKTFPTLTMTRKSSTVLSFANTCTDPESSSLTYQFVLTSTTSSTPLSCQDFTFNTTTQLLTLDFKTSSCSGTYFVRIQCSDSINAAVTNQFQFNAIDNYPIVAQSVSTKSIKFTDKTLAFNIPSIFTDPESRPFDVSLVLSTGSALPSFLQWSSSTSTLTFLGTYANAGTYNLKFVAVDDVAQSTQTSFSLVIQGCHSYCSSCTDVYQSTCSSCKTNYFLTDTTCRSYCDEGAYPDSQNRVCQDCPIGCDICSGPNSVTQCSVCSAGYFKLDNGCHAICPQLYYANRQTMQCELIPVTSPNYRNYSECLQFVSDLRAQYPGYLTEPTSTGVASFDEMSGASASCTGLVGCSGGSESGQTCTWTRKFALQCALSQTGLATIRVATNSMPDHCFGHASFFPQENNIDFEVAFNVRPSYLKTKAVNTQSLADGSYCDRAWLLDSNLREYYSYIGYSGIRDNIVGIAINGVPIMNGFSEFNYDFIYPKANGQYRYPKQVEVDVCLGYQLQTGFYHYYSASPCIFESTSRKQTHGDELCQLDDQECSTDPKQFIIDSYKSVNVKKIGDYPIVGIARDGHFILGPYKLDGTNVWQPCDVDACNGVRIDDQYMYVTTFFYPYTVACWGPSNDGMTFAAKCSSNTKVCSEQQGQLSGNAMSQFASGIYSILMAFAAMMFFANMI